MAATGATLTPFNKGRKPETAPNFEAQLLLVAGERNHLDLLLSTH